YSIRETQPANYTDGADALGSVGGTLGNDVLSGIALGPAQAGVGYTFGEGGNIVAGRVFLDRDRSSAQGPGEPGIGGILLALRDANGYLAGQAATGPAGNYVFFNVAPGTYRIEELQPATYASTTADTL